VFSDSFPGEVERDLHSIGRALAQQSDPNLPKTHFPLIGYLPHPKNEDNGSGKRNAHELHGALLTLLCFLLLNGQQRIKRKLYW